jgi:hypothetical protein
MSAQVTKPPKISAWRAADKHTGIGKSGGAPYTYEHVATRPPARAEAYRIETYIPFVSPTPIHRNVYYVAASRLDRFFDGWDEHAETKAELAAFRDANRTKRRE